MDSEARLPDAQLELWKAYLDQELQKVRSEIHPTLDRFVASLLLLSPEHWQAWALDVARRVVDDGEDVVVRFPLFRAVLFPALIAGINDSRPGCARWLAGLSHLLFKSPTCRDLLPPDLRTGTGLLRVALAQDPSDSRARRKLIGALASGFEYAIHEVPNGILWDANGADVQQCAQLRFELDEFCRLVDAEGLADQYQELIDDCRFHFSVYPEYLFRKDEYESYSEYLGSIREHRLSLRRDRERNHREAKNT